MAFDIHRSWSNNQRSLFQLKMLERKASGLKLFLDLKLLISTRTKRFVSIIKNMLKTFEKLQKKVKLTKICFVFFWQNVSQQLSTNKLSHLENLLLIETLSVVYRKSSLLRKRCRWKSIRWHRCSCWTTKTVFPRIDRFKYFLLYPSIIYFKNVWNIFWENCLSIHMRISALSCSGFYNISKFHEENLTSCLTFKSVFVLNL